MGPTAAGNGSSDAGASSPPPGAGTPGGVAGGAVAGGTLAGTSGVPGGFVGGTPGGTAIGGGGTGGVVGGAGAGAGGTAAGGPIGDSLDAGAAPDGGLELDGGVPNPPLDAGSSEAGLDAGEAGAPSSDGGDAGSCSPESLPRSDGGCAGNYCATSAGALSQTVMQGACRAPGTLALVCEGKIARSAAQCAQDNALSLSLGTSLRSCLRHDALLGAVASDCLDCYAQELLCTLSSCLATCVAGFEPACGDCRHANCGAQFSSCSGLPAP